MTQTNLVDAGTGTTSTVKNVTLYDSYGEVLQTQAAGDGGGAVLNDTTFDAADDQW